MVITLSDWSNDLAMIKYAGTGVVMDNAIDEIKTTSQFVTRINLKDGVALAIRNLS